ncbi:MAG: tetratricopeptide repeat protein, partial [Algicola sp.]|nr:tetratricopeptide repeat protein [Algicola sp.]
TRWQLHKTNIIGVLGIIGLAIIVTFTGMVIAPNEPVPVAKVGEFTAVDYSNQAQEYYYRFKPDDNFTAIDLYQKAIETDPNFSYAYAGLANAHAQAYYQYGQGEDTLQQAIKQSNRAIEIAPNQAWGYKSLGLAHHLNGHFNEAILAYDKAIERAPWWPSPVNNSAFVHQEAGRLIEAYQQVLTAIKMDTKDPIPYLFQGLVYRDLGMTAHALKAINRSIELKPDYLLGKNYLAEYYLAVGEHQKALALVEKTVARTPKNQFAHWLNAQIQLQLGDKAKAIKHFTQAAALGGRHQLIAQIYLAVLRQDHPEQQHLQLAERTNSTIAQGNQWPELIYAQGLLALVNQDYDKAMVSFDQAVDAGLRAFYLRGNAILPIELIELPAFKILVLKQTAKLTQARQQVMILEQAR